MFCGWKEAKFPVRLFFVLRRKFPGNFLNGVICDRFDSSNEKGCINFNVLKATCGNGSI